MQLAFAAGGIAGGGAIGSLIPGVGFLMGAQIGFLGASILHNILFPNEIDAGGPSRDDVRMGSAATGRYIPIPLVGSNRIAGQFRYLAVPDFREFQDEVGGKGGGTEVKTTHMFLTWNTGVCEAPAGGISAFTKVWLDDELVFDISETNLTGPALNNSIIEGLNQAYGQEIIYDPNKPNTVFEDGVQATQVKDYGSIRFYLGGEGQPEEPLMQTDQRITDAMGSDATNWISPAHGLAHVTFINIAGDAINNHLPQCEFEVLISSTDTKQGILYTPTTKPLSLLYWREDHQTMVEISGDIELDNYVGTWSLIEKNPTDMVRAYYNTDTAEMGIVRHLNVGSWDDPNLIHFAFNGAGDSNWGSWNGVTGAQVNAIKNLSVAGVQPIAIWFWPNTANPTQVVGVAETTDQLFSFPFTWDSGVADLDEIAIIRSNVAVPEFAITTASMESKPAFVGPDGLLYFKSGVGSTKACILAIDPLTLDIVRQVQPYRESPSADDLLWGGFHITYDPQTDKIYCVGTDVLRKVDRASLLVEGDDIEASGIGSGGDDLFPALMHGPINGRIWIQRGTLGNTYSEYDLVNMKLLRTIDVDDWAVSGWESEAEEGFYDPWNHALWTSSFFSTTKAQYLPLDRLGPSCGTAQEIANQISDRVGIPSSLRSTGAWAPFSICGYMLGRRITGRKALEVIAGMIGGDFRTQDAIVDFFITDTASVATIPEADVGFSDERDAPAPRRNITFPNERQMPYRIDMNYVDRKQDYAPNTVPADRNWEGFSGRDKEQIQMPVVFDDPSNPTPQAVAERLLHEYTTRKEQHAVVLSWEYLGLNVGDQFDYTVDGRTHSVRIEKWGLSPTNKIVVEGFSEDVSIHTPSSVDVVPQIPIFERPTLGGVTSGSLRTFFFDMSLLRDQDDIADQLTLYAGVAPFGSTFGGSTLYRSADDGASWEGMATFSPSQALTWGFAATALAEGRHGVIDRDTSFAVTMTQGSLPQSVSDVQLNNDRTLHALIYGDDGRWEVLRWRDTLDTTGSPDEEAGETYTLTGLRRGQSNTRHNQGSHVDGDRLVLVEASKLKLIRLDPSDLNVTYLWKMVPVGTSIANAVAFSQAIAGETSKPAPLSHVIGSRNISTGQWSSSATRGGRKAYQWVDLVTTPLGEETEEYEVDVLTGAGGTVIAGLTKTGLTTPSTTWSEADLVTYGLGIDGSPGQSPFSLTVKWYQVSALVGRGNTIEVTLTSPTPGN